jgi:hypothetical protein
MYTRLYSRLYSPCDGQAWVHLICHWFAALRCSETALFFNQLPTPSSELIASFPALACIYS